MTAYAFPTRRMLLRDMGKAGLAVMILGSAACASESTDNATPTPETSEGADTTGSTPTSAAASTTSPETSPTTGYQWHRVDLGFVSAYILYRNGEATVVDTGVSDSEQDIEAALGELGLGWESVGSVVVTHKHPDHQGSLEAVLAATDAPWYAGADEMAAISAPSQGTPVGDGDRVADLGIIATPGHTVGHICVLDAASGVLVAGDALTEANGAITGSNPNFTEDMGLANASVAKLADFDYEVVLFGHGEPVLEGGSALVGELARSGG